MSQEQQPRGKFFVQNPETGKFDKEAETKEVWQATPPEEPSRVVIKNPNDMESEDVDSNVVERNWWACGPKARRQG